MVLLTVLDGYSLLSPHSPTVGIVLVVIAMTAVFDAPSDSSIHKRPLVHLCFAMSSSPPSCLFLFGPVHISVLRLITARTFLPFGLLFACLTTLACPRTLSILICRLVCFDVTCYLSGNWLQGARAYGPAQGLRRTTWKLDTLLGGLTY